MQLQHRARRGVTMIEVLVAVLVLSIGLLGVAGTLARNARMAQGASAQTGVASGVADMAERLRTSPTATNANFTLTATYATQRSALLAGTVAPGRDCNTLSCTAAQSANFHIANWQLALDRSLPGAAGWVRPLSSASTSANATAFEVAVLWFDKTNVDGNGALVAALSCTGDETGVDQRRCCPSAAAAADGVRCTRLVVVP
jgi:type IV pilus assembly protein PilV